MTLELRFAVDLIILASACAFCLFLILKAKKNVFAFLLVPFLILAALDSYQTVRTMQGLSRANYLPEGEVLVLAAANEKKEWFHVWYIDGDMKTPRAIKFPYTEENKKKLESIVNKIKRGQNAFAQFKKKGRDGKNGSQVESNAVEITEYDFSTSYHNQKDR
jgi:hypothetical protein